MGGSKAGSISKAGYYFEASGDLLWLMAYTEPQQLLPTFFRLIEAAKLGPVADWEVSSFHGLPRYEGDKPKRHIFCQLPVNSVRTILERYQDLVMNDFDFGVVSKSANSHAGIPFVEFDRRKYLVFWESEPPYNEFSYKAAEKLLEGLGASYESLFELRNEFVLPPAVDPSHHQQFKKLMAELESCQQGRGSD